MVSPVKAAEAQDWRNISSQICSISRTRTRRPGEGFLDVSFLLSLGHWPSLLHPSSLSISPVLQPDDRDVC
ncbi:hypothetical protein PBY51_011169 [Eleginops maclovinus]|uniref:Uncharacterized protein n=1 Tax=Eleginops maclovinus TaxID=56733 RepID=A0AAN7XC61_ELEMC|nr:hypothetical protein PBY51_011169 [Eleginops maclovinus]